MISSGTEAKATRLPSRDLRAASIPASPLHLWSSTRSMPRQEHGLCEAFMDLILLILLADLQQRCFWQLEQFQSCKHKLTISLNRNVRESYPSRRSRDIWTPWWRSPPRGRRKWAIGNITANYQWKHTDKSNHVNNQWQANGSGGWSWPY